jgi:hypothetical protein
LLGRAWVALLDLRENLRNVGHFDQDSAEETWMPSAALPAATCAEVNDTASSFAQLELPAVASATRATKISLTTAVYRPVGHRCEFPPAVTRGRWSNRVQIGSAGILVGRCDRREFPSAR